MILFIYHVFFNAELLVGPDQKKVSVNKSYLQKQ